MASSFLEKLKELIRLRGFSISGVENSHFGYELFLILQGEALSQIFRAIPNLDCGPLLHFSFFRLLRIAYFYYMMALA